VTSTAAASFNDLEACAGFLQKRVRWIRSGKAKTAKIAD
jgi:hypothetical protein